MAKSFRKRVLLGIRVVSVVALASQGGLVAAPVQPDGLPEGWSFERVFKARADGCFFGVGDPDNSFEEGGIDVDACLQAGGTPKVNGSYIWGMWIQDQGLWFTTAANIPCLGAAFSGDGSSFFIPPPPVPPAFVCEGRERTTPFPADANPLFELVIPDWYPPQLWYLDLSDPSAEALDITPYVGPVRNVAGYRAVGGSDGVVIFVGIDVANLRMAAFDSKTLEFLGAKTFYRWSNARKFVKAQGKLYLAVQNSLLGTGEVLKWTGSRDDPFRFATVGQLDNEGGNLTLLGDRLAVGTWPASPWSSLGAVGRFFFGSPPAGVWLSPKLGRFGLTSFHKNRWQKIFDVTAYEPDPVAAQLYGIGDLSMWDGDAYFGTMHTPAFQDIIFRLRYGEEATQEDVANLTRPFAVFRIKNVLDPERRSLEVLYGDSELPVYDPSTGLWALQPNLLGEPLNGPNSAGINNRNNNYYWVSTVFNGRLLGGSSDIPTFPPPTPFNAVGADLFAFEDASGTALLYDDRGGPEPENGGWRTRAAYGSRLYLGSANPSNIRETGGAEVVELRSESCGSDAMRPSGGAVLSDTRQPTFSWCSEPVTRWYKLEIHQGSRRIVSRWLELQEGEQFWNPSVELECGEFRWTVLPYDNRVGFGARLGPAHFTVACDSGV